MQKLLFLVPLLILAGCSNLGLIDENRNTVSGAGAIMNEDTNWFADASSFSGIDYCEMLISYGFAYRDSDSSTKKCKLKGEKLDMSAVGVESKKSVHLRDDLQYRIIGASNQKCGKYLNYLHAVKSNNDKLFGSLSTIFAGAGAIINHASTAQAFSAAGAATAGVGAEFNQADFANLAIEVVTAGIRSKRQTILEDIAEKRADRNVNYPLNGAIADALEYHAACNVLTGFEAASESISRTKNPGTVEIRRFVEGLKGLRLEFVNTTNPETVNGGDAASKTTQTQLPPSRLLIQ